MVGMDTIFSIPSFPRLSAHANDRGGGYDTTGDRSEGVQGHQKWVYRFPINKPSAFRIRHLFFLNLFHIIG